LNSADTNFTYPGENTRTRRIKKPKHIDDLGFDDKSDKVPKSKKILKKTKIISLCKKGNKKTEHCSAIFQKMKMSEYYQKFSFFNRIEKQVKTGYYTSHQDLATDIRRIFNNYFTASVNDPESYSDTWKFSNYFEDIYKHYENKCFSKDSKNILELKKKMNKLRREIRERNTPNVPGGLKQTKLRIDINDFNISNEKEKKISKKYKLSLVNNIRGLNSDQIKGIINIIHDNLNVDEKTMEFDINNLPIEKLKELDKYVKKCLKHKSKQENISFQNNYEKEMEKSKANMNNISNMSNVSNGTSTLNAPNLNKRENINVNININNNFMVGNFKTQNNLLTDANSEDVLLNRKRNSILTDSDSVSSDEESGKLLTY
jgi:hypothetical protein